MSHIRKIKIKMVCPDCGQEAAEISYTCACGDSWTEIECEKCTKELKEYFKKHPMVRCEENLRKK